MQEENFIVREALVNPQERVIGYELCWSRTDESAAEQAAQARLLAAFVLEQQGDGDALAVGGEQLTVLAMPGMLLADTVCAALPPESTLLAVDGRELENPDVHAAARALRAAGTGIMARNLPVQADRALLAAASHVELDVRHADFGARLQHLKSLDLPALKIVARGVGDWRAFDACAKLGMLALCGNLHLTARPDSPARELNPAQTLILQLMDMLNKNADVKQLEDVLKRDAALSYKLLRYINSAGFGLGCEIQSLKHAVTMLGYTPLYRWLALLLATATTTGYSPVLMQTAVIRGRFVELLGKGLLPKNEAENLFVTGMFSLLDRLLGVPMEDVLEKVQLSEPVAQALLHREGIYGPFLALAEACEQHDPRLDDMATSLCIASSHVNQAQMTALAWARSLSI